MEHKIVQSRQKFMKIGMIGNEGITDLPMYMEILYWEPLGLKFEKK